MGGGGAGGDTNLVVDAPEVGLYGAGAEEEVLGDLRVRHPLRHEPQDFHFAGRKPGGVRRRGGRGGVEASGEGIRARKCGSRPERFADSACLVEQLAGFRSLTGRGTQFGQREQGQRAFVWRVARRREVERHRQMQFHLGIVSGLGLQFTQQTVGGEECQRLARVTRVSEGALDTDARLLGVARCSPAFGPEGVVF